MVGILNTQVGDRYIFSGTAINTPAVASADDILNGTATQAGLEAGDRRAAAGRSRHQRHRPARHHRRRRRPSVQVAEDVAGSPFGLKLALGVVVADECDGDRSRPARRPAVSVDFTAGNPNPGDQISLHLQSARRHHRIRSADGVAARRRCRPAASPSARRRPRPTANLNTALNIGDHDARQHLAGGGLGGRGRRQFLQHRRHGDRRRRQQPGDADAAPITGATALSGTSGTDSLPSSFAPATPSPSTARRSPSSRRARPATSSTSPTASRRCCPRSTRSPAPRRRRPSMAA